MATESVHESANAQNASDSLIGAASPAKRLDFITVESATDQRIAHFTNLKDPTLRLAEFGGKTARFIAEGETVSRHLLESRRYQVESVLLTPHHAEKVKDALDELESRKDLANTRIPIYICPADLLEKLSGFNFHRGILASARVPPPTPLADILASSRVLVVLEKVVSMDNVGSIFRNLACFVDVDEAAVLLTPDCCHPLYRKAIRVSVGHVLRVKFGTLNRWPTLWGKRSGAVKQTWDENATKGQYGADPALYADSPIYRGDGAKKLHPNINAQSFESEDDGADGDELQDDLAAIKAAGFQTIAMTPHPTAKDIRDFSRTVKEQNRPKIAIILGAEGPGLQLPVLERADHRIKIPMSEGSDSLNVATSLAVALSWLV